MKIAFCIFACATKERFKKEINGILNSWGTRAKNLGHTVLFFLGEEKTDLTGDNFIYLPGVKNDYESASYKHNLGLKMIYEKYNDYDFVYTCGTDTYVHIDNLVETLKNYDTYNPFILGGDGGPRKLDKEIYFNSGGPGYVISRKAMDLLYPLYENMFENWKKLCIESKQRDLIPGCDVALAYYGDSVGVKSIKDDTKFFHCSYKESKVNLDIIIAVHDIKVGEYMYLHKYFFP